MAGGQGYQPGPMQSGGMTAMPMPGVMPQPGSGFSSSSTVPMPGGGPSLAGGRFPTDPSMTPGGPSMGGGRMPMGGGLGGGLKPMPGSAIMPGPQSGGLDQWAGLLPARLQAQVGGGLPLEQAIGRFQGQLRSNPGMPSWENPLVQELMSQVGAGGNKPMPGGGEMPRVPYGGDMISMPMPGVDQGRTAPRPGDKPAGATPAVPPAPSTPATQPPNAYTQALAAATRPGFDSAVRGGGYDWKRDRDRALGLGEFATKPAAPAAAALPGNPIVTPVEPQDGGAGKPLTKPALPKGARRLPKP